MRILFPHWLMHGGYGIIHSMVKVQYMLCTASGKMSAVKIWRCGCNKALD